MVRQEHQQSCIDKLTHAFNAYLFAEFLGARIARKTDDRAAAALPAAMLSTALQFYGELWDGHKTDSGFSYQDIVFNTAGAAFSVLRHTVPGLEEKLDFRLMMVPNSNVYSFKGKRHYEQQHFLLSLELAGFRKLEASPLQLVELQVGYRGKDFTLPRRPRRRHPPETRHFLRRRAQHQATLLQEQPVARRPHDRQRPQLFPAPLYRHL